MLEYSDKHIIHASVEHDRLEELNALDITGTQPELRFNSIVRAAGALFHAPMAFLTLVGHDRQWFKAAVGLDVAEIDKRDSFCAHTIMSHDVFIIPDAGIDIRFSDNPFVTGEPHIRFYAGAPLVTKNGNRLGALCVVDTQPRLSFTREQRVSLQCLADLAVEQLILRCEEMQQKSFAALANGMLSPLLAIGHHGIIEFANDAAHELFEVQEGSLIGSPLDLIMTSDTLHGNAETLALAFEHSPVGAIAVLKRLIRMPNLELKPVRIVVSRWERPVSPGLAIAIESPDAPLALKFSTNHLTKGLTRLANETELATCLARDICGNASTSLFLMAPDRLEELLDDLGRTTGDVIQKYVSRRLHLLFPNAELIACLSNGDFALVLRGLDTNTAHKIANKLSSAFDTSFEIEGRVVQITASVGYVSADLNLMSSVEFISDADFALRSVRRPGGHGTRMYEPGLRRESAERYQMQVELLRALQHEEFRLHYQPQVSLKTGEILGFEVLMRWQHPQRGLLFPSDFLHVIGESRLALPIGWWVLDEACAQLARWRREQMRDFRIAVNLFSAQFRSDSLVKNVSDALHRHDIPPSLLELEVTETIALLDDESGIASFRRLRNMGTRIAFDDFGMGYASLSSLQRFPLTTLKLDRSFVEGVMNNHSDAAIVRSMISMANELNLETIAEGIETTEQAAFLQGLNCSVGQGYLYGKPMAPDAVLPMLHRSPFRDAKATHKKRARG